MKFYTHLRETIQFDATAAWESSENDTSRKKFSTFIIGKLQLGSMTHCSHGCR